MKTELEMQIARFAVDVYGFNNDTPRTSMDLQAGGLELTLSFNPRDSRELHLALQNAALFGNRVRLSFEVIE